LIHRFLEEPDLERRSHAVPYLGAVLLGATILALLLGLLLPGMGHGWASPRVIGLLALSIVLLGAFIASDRRAREPIFDASLLRMRMFLACNISGFFASATLNGAAAFIPLFVHAVMGRTATEAGFALTPMSIGWVMAAYLAGRMILRVGYRAVSTTGLALLATGALLISTIGIETRYPSILVYMFTMGAGLGLSFTAFLIATQNSVRKDQVSQATAGLHLLRQTGTVVGMAVLGAILMGTLPPDLRDGAGGIPLHEIKDQITEKAVALRGPIASSIRAILMGGAAFSLAALVAGLFVPGGVAEKHLREEEGT
jgi:Na+/melibiose symporter-like transporter